MAAAPGRVDAGTAWRLAALGVLLASGAGAEPFGPDERRPAVPAPELLPTEPFELPPIAPSSPGPRAARAGEAAVRLRDFVFEGNSVFEDAELAAVVKPFLGRPLSFQELRAARDALTLHYVDAGYATSGARIPDQTVEEGRLRIELVEGRLAEIRIQGQRWYRASALRRRISRSAGTPLHAPSLEREIRLLQQDSRIGRVDAVLRPGARLGESVLVVRVDERQPYRAFIESDNRLGPSLGEVRGRLLLRHENPAGLGDQAFVLVGGYEAGPEIEAGYRVPFTRYATHLETRFRWTESDLVDSIGDDLQVEGRFYNLEFGLSQPVIETPEFAISLGAFLALRDARIDILNGEFDRTRLTVLRFDQELSWRGGDQVLAARSRLSWGIGALGATRERPWLADSRFVSWLGQMQWVRRIAPMGVEFLARGDLQLSHEPLPTLEQISLGGHASVRGYRENRRVRDQGVVASVEVRAPLFWTAAEGRTLVQLAAFFDVGHGWNRKARAPRDPIATPRRRADPRTLYSTGVGLRVQPWRFVVGELYWGVPLADSRGTDGIQGHGLHFRARLELL